MASINSILGLTEIEEGGLSRATTDTASKNPSPYVYKGKTGWHTNRGVTYATFKGLASRLGYKDTFENFILMPDDIFLKIAKNGFWDVLNLDKMNSQALANIFFSWQWGAGSGWKNRIVRYLKTKSIVWDKTDLKNFPILINKLVEKIGEKKAIDEIITQFSEFYKSLNQPVYIKGWLNRLGRLKEYSYTLIGETLKDVKEGAQTAVESVKKNPIKTTLIVLLIIGIILQQINSNNK
jgi:hypothetical protein